MKTYVFPGQGSQRKGMGGKLFDAEPELTAKADKILGFSIKELCLKDPDKLLGQTEYTQPALYTVNALTWLKTVKEEGTPDFVAGHSLGEYNALFAAGVFDFETGLKLVKERGRLMAKAEGGGMAAAVGRDENEIKEILQESGFGTISVANYNSPYQIVVSGTKEEITKAAPVFKNAGVKYLILNVSGAFHSVYMKDVQRDFTAFINKLKFAGPKIPVIANVTGKPCLQKDIKKLLIDQIVSPVQWTESIFYLLVQGEMEFKEIGPGKVLTGLISKIRESGRRRRQITASSLGHRQFKEAYGLKYAYLTGAMANGIASKELVISVGKAGMMGFLGTGGLSLEVVEKDIIAIKKALGNKPYGMNLVHTPESQETEEEFVDLYMRYGVTNIEAAAFMQMTPALIKYRLAGLYEKDNGKTGARNKIMGKVSRPELAQAFYSPAPEHIVKKLLDSGKVSDEQAKLSKTMPMADALCVEADSGGHTDQGVAYALMPAILRLRKEMAEKYGYQQFIFTGSAGGIGAPEAAAAAFILGADFVLTGSINQCTIEAGTSDMVKDMLSQMDVQDTDYAPAGDMFEIGAKVQVLRKGVFFPARANKLYSLYKHYNSFNEIDEKTKAQIQKLYFKKSFDEIYEETKAFWIKRGYPGQIEKAEKNPKHKMALIFKWYFKYASMAAMEGRKEDKVNFQIHTGPALGSFNRWVKGGEFENWRNRRVDKIGVKLMKETATLLNNRFEMLKVAGGG